MSANVRGSSVCKVPITGAVSGATAKASATRRSPRTSRYTSSPTETQAMSAKTTAPTCGLTVKLRGRTEAPALGAEGAQALRAQGDNPEAPHGPLQRLLGGVHSRREIASHSSREQIPDK